jgi:serine phosphatase RsbU (regulator of sigma subunit)/sugar lactone lactonase YvrE
VAEEDRGDDSKWVYDIHQAQDGILWLATFGGGLGRFDPNTRAYSAFTAEEHGLSSNHLFRVEPDPTQPNMLWLGTANGGLERFDMVGGNVVHFRADPKNPATLSSDEVTAIYPDGAGVVWIGTFGAGLNRLDVTSKKVERFTTTNSGLSNDTVFAIVPDGKGKLWISTNGGGLLSFDPKAKTFLRFTERDGLNSNEFAQGSFLKTAGGELIFGGLGGFNAFYPAEIAPDPQPPLVVFTGLRRFNQEERLERPIWASSGLDLSFSDSFEIGFAALSYAAPDQNRFQYQLEGLDDRWIDTTHPFASYTRLPGGDYTFRVRAANRHGVWNQAGASIPISISPPPWRTWWAYGLYVLAAGLILYAVMRFQKQKVTRLQKENRLASIERDLEITATVQACFLPPSNTIDFGPYRVVGFYRPAAECGGDWWWYEHTGGSRHLIVVGDVTGHGVGPAMMTAAVATAFRVLTQSGTTTLEGLLDPLNREVLKFADGRYRMTMTGVEIDGDTGRYITWSAGAPPLLCLSNEGQANVVMARGTPLGTASFHAGQATGVLQPGQRLMLYSDGILESTLPNGRQIGLRRFARMLESTRAVGLGQAAQQIVSEADALHAGILQEDDWTFALLERRGPQTPL